MQENTLNFDMTTDEDSMPRSVAFIRDLQRKSQRRRFWLDIS